MQCAKRDFKHGYGLGFAILLDEIIMSYQLLKDTLSFFNAIFISNDLQQDYPNKEWLVE